MTSSNVFDGRHRFGSREERAKSLAQKIAETISSVVRVPDADKPILAQNLGRLSERIDPLKPLEGARKIIDRAGLESIWHKRKRFIRLSEEAAPPPTSSGEYGSSGATFVRLAQAAGELLSPNERLDSVASERARAVVALATGTSFMPAYTPLTGTDRSAKKLVDDYAAAIVQAVSTRTRLLELWETLDEFPVSVISLLDHEDVPLDVPSWAILPEELRAMLFPSFFASAFFSTSDKEASRWAFPQVEIGTVAVQMEVDVIAIPSALGSEFVDWADVDDVRLAPAAINWLSAVKFGPNGELPSGSEAETRTTKLKVSCLRTASLELVRGADAKPHLDLVLWGSNQDIAYSIDENGLRVAEKTLVAGEQVAQVSLIDFGGGVFWLLHERPFEMTDEERPPVVAVLDFLWDHDLEMMQASGGEWTAHPTNAALLLTDRHRFYPRYVSDESGVAIRSGSIGAALYGNLVDAPDDERFHRTLLERARLIADTGIAFHERLVERSRDSLRRI